MIVRSPAWRLHVTIEYEDGAWHLRDMDGLVFTAPFTTEAEARAYLSTLTGQGFIVQEHKRSPAQPQAALL